ncbi:unnamed protein product [Gongylonema pulchrum]|uniref:Secreted protein n=1 Tax=Gongylonema pulchrum TaxID=637853 RepID=A0A183E8T5_9BILA|nr:unnamed protein product [Gongylonema pulchrum]
MLDRSLSVIFWFALSLLAIADFDGFCEVHLSACRLFCAAIVCRLKEVCGVACGDFALGKHLAFRLPFVFVLSAV